MAVSRKSHEVLSRLVAMGASAVILPPKSLIAWAHSPVTEAALGKFAKDVTAGLLHGVAS